VIASNSSGEIVEFNRAAETITGYSRAELAGRPWLEVICPRSRCPEVWEELERLGPDNLPHSFESRILTKSGEERHVLWSSGAWRNGRDERCTIAFGLDTTEQHIADAALAETAALLGSIIEGGINAVFAKNLDGKYVLVNARAAELLGRSKEEILGKNDLELFPDDVAREFREGDRRVIESGESFSYAEESATEDGTWRYRLSAKGPTRDERGNLMGVFGIATDVTQLKTADEALARAARESEQLAHAAMKLIECRSDEDILSVVAEFFADVVPNALTFINRATPDGEYFETTHVLGANAAQLARAGELVGLEVVGSRHPITEEYRRDFSAATLLKVPGGLAALAGTMVPRQVVEAITREFGHQDAYTIGIAENGAEFGCVHVVMTEPGAEPPVGIIDAFGRQCLLAICAIARTAEMAETAQRLEIVLAERERNMEALARSFSAVVDVVGSTVEMRDPYTAGHQQRVALLAVRIAREMGMAESDIEDIRVAALMHDVGKLSVPAELLSKPGNLTPTEMGIVKHHALAGYEIVRSARMREPIAELIYQHHERCNGSGYPRGLHAAHLHPGAKVLMVADLVEAMASHRPYRPAVGIDAAIAEISRQAGILYDRGVVDACIAVVNGGFEFDPSTGRL